jgi:alkylation response protein AidB-like acyl-CoA dehydrogenase
MQDLLEIRTLARDFAAAELRPHAEHWDAARAFDDDVVDRLAELGFFGMLVPEPDGGMGFDLGTTLAALEELAWGEPSVALLVAETMIAADLIAQHGDDALREQWLPRFASADALATVACATDDTSSLTASRSASSWSLRGRAEFVACGERADLIIVLAADGDTHGVFAIPRGSGVKVGARANTLGLRPLAFVDLEFDDVAGERLFTIATGSTMPQHAVGELCTAAIGVGIAQAALEHAVAYADQREQFGRPIRSFEGVQGRLAEMATRLYAARALLERAASDPADALSVAIAKLTAGEAAMHVTDNAVQVFGGYGYMRDYPVEKLMRDAKAIAILHGPSEVQRRRIAAALYADQSNGS